MYYLMTERQQISNKATPKLLKVKGKALPIGKFKTFLVKPCKQNHREYTIHDLITGALIESGKTEEEAINNAKKRLNNVEDRTYKEAVKYWMLKKYSRDQRKALMLNHMSYKKEMAKRPVLFNIKED